MEQGTLLVGHRKVADWTEGILWFLFGVREERSELLLPVGEIFSNLPMGSRQPSPYGPETECNIF